MPRLSEDRKGSGSSAAEKRHSLRDDQVERAGNEAHDDRTGIDCLAVYVDHVFLVKVYGDLRSLKMRYDFRIAVGFAGGIRADVAGERKEAYARPDWG